MWNGDMLPAEKDPTGGEYFRRPVLISTMMSILVGSQMLILYHRPGDVDRNRVEKVASKRKITAGYM